MVRNFLKETLGNPHKDCPGDDLRCGLAMGVPAVVGLIITAIIYYICRLKYNFEKLSVKRSIFCTSQNSRDWNSLIESENLELDWETNLTCITLICMPGLKNLVMFVCFEKIQIQKISKMIS